MKRLAKLLRQIDGCGFKAYQQLVGCYQFASFRLSIDHVQGDPFALPSRVSIQVDPARHGLPPQLWNNRIRQTALEDALGRAVAGAIGRHVKGGRGTGRSGAMEIACSGQQVLRRNAVLIAVEGLEARLLLALPGSGRSILGGEAAAMFFEELPAVVRAGLEYAGRDIAPLQHHVEQVEDQQALRDWLGEHNLLAFVANGAVLPRRSGIDDRPLAEAIPFHSPAELETSVTLPNQGTVKGMAIPRGITLIVGGGFHGKSTLLQALERGVYNHLPGDGRELVVTTADAVKIRAEDHRSVNQVDISPFIGALPGNRPTACFSTENASGSTSQAANIVEALECGCRCLLIDEDTSATNFMLRDRRMRQLVPDRLEPITPLLYRVRDLYEREKVSTVIVSGGSGDYLAVADRVLMLDNYRVRDVSDQARQLAGELPPETRPKRSCHSRTLRRIDFHTAPFPGQRQTKILVREQRLLDYGRRRIDLSQVEQLVDAGQTEAIGLLLDWCRKHDPHQQDGLISCLKTGLEKVESEGLDILLPWKAGHLAMPRLFELAAAANRLRPV
jgi:predicted ABC-class ATPase